MKHKDLGERTSRRKPRTAWLIGMLLFLVPSALIVPGVLFIGVDNLVLVFRDPNRLVDVPWYYGFYSNMGIVLWSVTAGICLFAGLLLAAQRRWDRAMLLLGIGTLTGVLCMDDLYQIHENAERMAGISEEVLFGSYALILAVILLRFRRLILRQTQWGLLAFSLAFFVMSLIVDLTWRGSGLRHLFEDGPKLVGIFGWLGYWSITAFELIRSELISAGTGGPEGRAVSTNGKAEREEDLETASHSTRNTVEVFAN
jgi:hypothetical protein